MFENLVVYATSIPREEVATIEIEEMAIVLAWFNSHADDEPKISKYSDIPEIADYWVNNVKKDDRETQGRRLQPLLRYILDQIVLQGIDTLHRSELDVLSETYDLIQRVPDKKLYERLSTFFANKIEVVRKRRATLPNAPGLIGVRKRLSIVTPTEIESSRPRSVRSFAGVDLPSRGPVFQSSGDTKVMGAVPEDCMLVVDGGACLVNGYILGRVAAATSCEVRENISGVVIVREGDIRARNLLTNAFVVSKWGSVHVQSTENPKLVFAGKEIHIHENAMHGTYASPTIRVRQEVVSGDYAISDLLSANRFTHSDSRDLIISLRRRISCEDYGGLVDRDATKFITKISKLRRRRDNWKNMDSLAENESEHFASNALMFLAGGEDLRSQLEEINSSERRLAYLDRVVAAIDAMSITVEDQISAKNDPDRSEADSETADQSVATIRDLQSEMAQIEEEGELDEDLSKERSEISEIVAQLDGHGGDDEIPASILFDLRERKLNWFDARVELFGNIAESRKLVRDLVGDNEIFAGDREDLSDLKILSRLLKIAYKRASGDRLYERANTPFMHMMLRSIEARRQRRKSYANMLEDIEKELKMEIDRLEQDCHMAPPQEQDEEHVPPRVQGRFQEGVTLCTDRNLLDEKDLPPQSVLVIQGSGDQVRCYARQRDRIAEYEKSEHANV